MTGEGPTGSGPIVELRLRPSMRLFMLIAVPAMAVLAVLGSLAILTDRPNPGPDRWLLVGGIVLVLGGLVVVGGGASLIRDLRGVPDVRIDQRGIVWGRDRDRDLSIDWDDVEGVTTEQVTSGVISERAFVIRLHPGRPGHPATSLFGRILGVGNRLRYGAPYTISTFGMDHSWEEVRAALGSHLPGRPFDQA